MIGYTGVNRILSSIQREIGDNPFSEEDIIEWIGEAMEFLKVLPILEESVKFIKVKDNKAKLPRGLVHVLQVSRLHEENVLTEYLEKTIKEKDEPCCEEPKCECYNEASNDYTWEYKSWVRSDVRTKGFTPVRLATSTYFKSLVCKEKDYDKLYATCSDEYSILSGEQPELLLSFKDGVIALSFVKMLVDKETGYPLIPDQADFLAAIGYYVKWKISEAMTWRGREGYSQMLQLMQGMWLKYAKQAKNWAKMPKSIDEWQNLMEQQYNFIPDIRAYYRGFNDIARLQNYGDNRYDARQGHKH